MNKANYEEELKEDIREREKYKDNCFACNHSLGNHKHRGEDKSGWNCTFPDCSCPFTIEDIKEHDIELKATLKGYQKAKEYFKRMIDERIKNYKELHNKFPENSEFLAKWEAMVELKSQLEGKE